MDTTSTITPATPRKKMPSEVFVKIYEGEIKVTETEWADWVVVTEAHKIGMVPIDKCIKFNRVEVTGDIEIIGYDKEVLPRLILSDCNIPALACIHVTSKLICVEQNTRIGNLWIRGISEIGRILVESNSSIQDFIIERSIVDSILCYGECLILSIRIEISSIMRSFQVGHSTIGQISFKNSVIKQVEIIHTVFQRFKVSSESLIVHLSFHFNLQESVHILLDDSHFAHLDFGNTVFPEFTTLSVSNCNVNRLTLSNSCNYGTIFFNSLSFLDRKRFLEVKKKWPFPISKGVEKEIHNTALRLTDSDLGKIKFINCDLREFERFEFSNTKMLDVFVAGSQMPGDKAFCLPDKASPLEIAVQKRLAYGQFKRIYETQGDLAGSLRYLSYEMDAYREQLIQEKTRPRFSKKWWRDKNAWDNRGERATLWLNKISTNYGNNWLRGLIMTLLMMSICFTIFCWMLGYRLGNDWRKFGELVSYAPYYLNPLRDLDSVSMINENKEMPIEWYARIWDFISRIIVAYFAYQTIQAFRKLGKSSG